MRLRREAETIQKSLENRFEAYAMALISTRSYLYGTNSKSSFNEFLADMQLFDKYPGLNAVGYADVVAGTNLGSNALRLSRMVPNFSLDAYALHSEHYAIAIQIYPTEDLDNQKVLGIDFLSNTAHKLAAMKSIYMDKPQLSEHIPLLADSDKAPQSTGAILFLPVYTEKGPRHEKSLANTKGLLFTVFRSSDLYPAVLTKEFLSQEKVNVRLEMISKSRQTTEIFESNPEIQSETESKIERTFYVMGQQFRLTVFPRQNFYNDYDVIFPYLISLLSLIVCALISLNLRNNASYAADLGRTNRLLNETLKEQNEKQKDLYVLNRTLQKMSHSLDGPRIMESFMDGVSEIFRDRGKFAIYSAAKDRDSRTFQLIISSDEQFFVSDYKANPKLFGQIFSLRENDDSVGDFIDCEFLLKRPFNNCRGLFSRIDSSAFGSDAFSIFVSTSGRIEETEIVLLKALTKHLNASLQNTLLLKRVEDSNRSKTAFLANMSHEIRTPLNALMGFSEILSRTDIDPNTRQELSENILKNGQQLTRLVDDILDLSKIEAGKMVIEKKPTNLNELIREIETVMALRLKDTQVEMKVEMDPRVPAHIQADPLRLKQILTNLIGNSIKFTNRGFVRLRVMYEKRSDETRVIFRVEDTGSGINRDFQDKLFFPFSQADTTATRKHGGAGLGLAISKRLASEMGGTLGLTFSEKDIGSVFELTIPVEEATQNSDQGRTDANVALSNNKLEQSEPLKQKKILLVEDSLDNQEFFQFFLTRAGGKLKIVNNGLEAVDEAQRTRYDIILMDIQIPGIDGKEATRRIRSQGYFGPIVALTAHAMQEEQESCIHAGCDGQISKPVSGQMLISRVSHFIQKTNGSAS